MPQIKEKRTHTLARATPYSVSSREPSTVMSVQKENSNESEAPRSQPSAKPWRLPTTSELELIQHLITRENRFPLSRDILSNQIEIDCQMRKTLYNWLYDVVCEFGLSVVTFYLTINYIDRYCENQLVTRGKYQLVGITCLFIAMKFEEQVPLSYKSLALLCDNAYSPDEILLMESEILNVLSFDLCCPTPVDFISFIMQLWINQFDAQTLHLTSYLSELSSLEPHLARFRHSTISLACFILALTHAGKLWGRELAECVRLDCCSTTFYECLSLICDVWNDQSRETTAVFAKYSTQQFDKVALLPPITL